MNISKEIKEQLKKIAGKDGYFDNPEELITYSYDATNFAHKPDIVLFPVNAKQVSEILKVAHENEIPVYTRGAGTNLSGGSIPLEGGIALVLTRMNKVTEISAENLTAVVEPGVVTEEFKKEVEKQGLFYPPDPASMAMCTLGGNIAENAGGPHCLKYGVTKHYVLGLEAVLANGDIINTGSCTIKNVTGYDLTSLFVGSEGTLGVITKIILKLIPLPKEKVTILAVFDKMEEAVKSVSKILSNRLLPSVIEFMDNIAINCAEEYLKMGLPVDKEALILIEFDDNMPKLQAQKAVEICKELGAVKIEVEDNPEGCEKLFKARKAAAPALGRVAPFKLMEDIVIPRNKLSEFMVFVKELINETGVKITSFGHAGDGNIHVNILLKDRSEKEMEKGNKILAKLFRKVMELNGVVTGEHGIGFLKAEYLEENVGTAPYELMKKIKQMLDPKNILNPGKVFKEI